MAVEQVWRWTHVEEKAFATWQDFVRLVNERLKRLDVSKLKAQPAAAIASSDSHLRLQRELQIVKNAGTVATVTPVGLAAPTLVGGSNADATDGAWVAMTTTNVIGNVAGMQAGSTTIVGRLFQWSGEAIFRIKMDGTVSSLRHWIGMANTVGTLAGKSTPGVGDEVAAFRLATDVDLDFFWRCVTHDGSGGPPTVTKTNVAITGNGVYKMLIVGTPSEIRFYINDLTTPVAIHTTTRPGSGTVLAFQTSVTTLVASPRTLRFSRAAFLFD